MSNPKSGVLAHLNSHYALILENCNQNQTFGIKLMLSFLFFLFTCKKTKSSTPFQGKKVLKHFVFLIMLNSFLFIYFLNYWQSNNKTTHCFKRNINADIIKTGNNLIFSDNCIKNILFSSNECSSSLLQSENHFMLNFGSDVKNFITKE